MKVRVTLKDPDSMPDAVVDAFERHPRPEGITDAEWEDIRESRQMAAQGHITDKWMPYAEYITIEFDTETGAATVIPASEFR